MNTLIVVNELSDWPFLHTPGTVVPALDYLTDSTYHHHAAQVINMCGTIEYQSIGYYVSLLAEARHQQPLPEVKTIEDLESDTLTHLLAHRLDPLIQQALARVDAPSFELHCYFGCDPQKQAEELAQELFKLLPAPLLHARFERTMPDGRRWQLAHVSSMPIHAVPPAQWPHIQQSAAEYLLHHPMSPRQPFRRRSLPHKPTVAILYDPDCEEPPSNVDAIDQFQRAALALDMTAEVITRNDSDRLANFDALFIRDTTSINHYTYLFSRQAAVDGMVVMDDPDSILKCTNKVYLTELFNRHHIPIPKTLMVHRGNIDEVIPTLGLPCILKQPDGAFSLGVVKIQSEQQLATMADRFLQKSSLILAQEYLPTEFDWRIGVLDRKPLFACKYFMAAGHWQIIKRQQDVKLSEGQASAVPLTQVPAHVMKTALAAANLIGDGFYGVDLKQIGQQCFVIEINDNPNVDMGNEDGVLKDALYQEVMQVFRQRIEAPFWSRQG